MRLAARGRLRRLSEDRGGTTLLVAMCSGRKEIERRGWVL